MYLKEDRRSGELWLLALDNNRVRQNGVDPKALISYLSFKDGISSTFIVQSSFFYSRMTSPLISLVQKRHIHTYLLCTITFASNLPHHQPPERKKTVYHTCMIAHQSLNASLSTTATSNHPPQMYFSQNYFQGPFLPSLLPSHIPIFPYPHIPDLIKPQSNTPRPLNLHPYLYQHQPSSFLQSFL